MYLALDGAERLLTVGSQNEDPAMYPDFVRTARSSATVQGVTLKTDGVVGPVRV